MEPTSWGNVFGRVYDAVTGSPIPKANVIVETDDGFVSTGRSSGVTDELGGYKAQCILGRISHNFDVGRALLTSGLGMLFGGATNTTKRVDVARVNLRVSVSGYKPFEGVAIARSQDAGDFRIDIEPVLLVPDQGQGGSVSATGWAAVRIVGASSEPPVAHKGDTIKLSATVRAFGKDPRKTIELAAVSKLWKGERRMKLSEQKGAEDLLRFEVEYKVSGKEKSHVEPVYFYIRHSVLDYNRDRAVQVALVQIANDGSEEQFAKDRRSAMDLYRSDKGADASAIFKHLTAGASATAFDLRMLANLSEQTSNFDGAADAWQRLALAGSDDVADDIAQYARALYLGRKYAAVPPAVEPALKAIKPKDWHRKIEPMAVGYLGQAYVKLGQLDQANKVNEDLLEWPTSGLTPSVIEFRNALRLAVVEKANANAPNSPAALADYGRALLDLGRYEEAVGKLKQALDLDANQPAIRRDLAWAALQMHGAPPRVEDLTTAVAEAKAALNIDNGKQRSKDFASWNQYAVLLFALSEQQRVAASPASADTCDQAITALREALSLGRVGATRSAGAFSYTYGYLSGSEVAISGFAYPQANSSFVLLDSLKKLRKNPADYLALFNQASALMDLGQTTLAEQSVARLLALRPDFVEGEYLNALIQARKGDPAKAEESLAKVLVANPLHPRAHLVLADLLAKDGDVAASAEHLAAHAKYYGETTRGQ